MPAPITTVSNICRILPPATRRGMIPANVGEGSSMVDLFIRGDMVVTPQGVGAYDIAIAGEKIVGVAASGSFPPPPNARVIDAAGKIVMPGGIDPHVHCKWHLPNPDGSAGLTEPPDVVSKAAVHGGTTTMIDFTRASPRARWRPARQTGKIIAPAITRSTS